MNNDNFENFIANLESIKMTKDEKTHMRIFLSDFAAHNIPRKSPYYGIMGIAKRSFATAFIIIFSVGSITHIAAQGALPGETLYKLKLAQEEITLASKNTTGKKVSYEIERTQKRIQEATRLAQVDKLDETKQQEIAVNIQEQSQKVQDHIEEIKKTNPEQALLFNSELKSTIKVNTEALRKVTTHKKSNNEDQDKVHVIQNIEMEIPELYSENVKMLSITNETGSLNLLNEVSSAKTLLGSIDENIKDLEDDEIQISKEITNGTNNVTSIINPVITPTVQKAQPETVVLPESPLNPQNSPVNILLPQSDTNQKIIPSDTQQEESVLYNLEKVISLKKEIQDLKGDDTTNHIHIKDVTLEDGTIITKTIFDEDALRTQGRLLIDNGSYKEAFLIYQKIREHHQEEKITKEVEKDLGISKNTEAQKIQISPEEKPKV